MCTQTANQAPLGTTSAPQPKNDIRIYVACLAAYNSGHLHGRWIDATQGVNYIWDETKAMLAASPIEDAEEHAIHDYEGFEGAPVEEYSSFETVFVLAEFIEEHGPLGGKVLEHFSGDIEDAKTAFEDYSGEYESLENFAHDLAEQTGAEIPEGFAPYIDYAAMGRDIELNGDIFTIEMRFDEIHVFWVR